MKKILTFALALLVAATTVACGSDSSSDSSDNSGDNKKVSKDEKAVTEAAGDFTEALLEFDFEEMTEHSNYDFVEEFGAESMDDYLEAYHSEELSSVYDQVTKRVADEYDDTVDEYIEGIMDAVKDSAEYKITSVTEKKDSWKVKIEFATINIDELIESIEDECADDVEDILGEYDGQNLNTLEADEVADITLEAFTDIYKKYIKNTEDCAEDLEKYEGEITLIVIQEDGEWIVDYEESDLDEFKEIRE